MIDLHCHTNASDGEKRPGELVAKAIERGLSAIAVTDHDTMAGIAGAIDAANGTGLEIVPGIEFSTFVDDLEVHLLGFFLPLDDAGLNSFLAKLTAQREERGRKMVQRVNDIGYELTFEETAAVADGAPIMSPHIVRALWQKGTIKDFEEATKFYLEHLVGGKDVYIQHSVDVKEILAVLDGVRCPVAIAHPHKIGDDRVVAELIKMGCGGMEGYYPDTDDSVLRRYRDWAKRVGMFLSGGSDYHGIHTTRKLGSANVPDEVLVELKKVRDGLREG